MEPIESIRLYNSSSIQLETFLELSELSDWLNLLKNPQSRYGEETSSCGPRTITLSSCSTGKRGSSIGLIPKMEASDLLWMVGLLLSRHSYRRTLHTMDRSSTTILGKRSNSAMRSL